MMILLLAGLRSLPKAPFEAAALDGVPRSFVFFRITLPMLMPYIITATLFRLLDSIQDHYTPSQPGIQRMIYRLRELVHRIDGARARMHTRPPPQGLNWRATAAGNAAAACAGSDSETAARGSATRAGDSAGDAPGCGGGGSGPAAAASSADRQAVSAAEHAPMPASRSSLADSGARLPRRTASASRRRSTRSLNSASCSSARAALRTASTAVACSLAVVGDAGNQYHSMFC
jgi:hypothetical protein